MESVSDQYTLKVSLIHNRNRRSLARAFPGSRLLLPCLFVLSLVFLACEDSSYNPVDPANPDFVITQWLRCNLFREPNCPLGPQPLLPNGKTWTNMQLVVNTNTLTGVDAGKDSVGVGGPSVIKDGNTYKMWYFVYDGTNHRIAYAESLDGKNWSNHRVVLDTASSGTGWDTSSVADPYIIKEGGLYRMWYGAADGVNFRLLYAESSDGITWSNFQASLNNGTEANGYDSVHALQPAVVSNTRLLYTGIDGGSVRHILQCSSSDGGKTWSGCALGIPLGTSGTGDSSHMQGPESFQDIDRYKVWYGGTSVGSAFDIFYCETTDFSGYTNCQKAIAKGSQSTYDTTAVTSPSVLAENGVGKMWYMGNDGTNTRILYAESY